MKKNKLVYVLGALLSMGVVSCDLTEKPTSFYEMDTYFTTADKAKMAVIGIYDCLAAEGSYGQYVMPFASSDDSIWLEEQPPVMVLVVIFPIMLLLLPILGLLPSGIISMRE